MKVAFTCLGVLGALLLLPGCAHVELSHESEPDRVMTGTVSFPGTLPAGAQVLVRVIDATPMPQPVGVPHELPLTAIDRARATPVERVVGEQLQTLTSFAAGSVPFRIEYQANDSTLRHGLNVEARASVDGKVRYRTIRAHVVTLASAPYPQAITIDPVQ